MFVVVRERQRRLVSASNVPFRCRERLSTGHSHLEHVVMGAIRVPRRHAVLAVQFQQGGALEHGELGLAHTPQREDLVVQVPHARHILFHVGIGAHSTDAVEAVVALQKDAAGFELGTQIDVRDCDFVPSGNGPTRHENLDVAPNQVQMFSVTQVVVLDTRYGQEQARVTTRSIGRAASHAIEAKFR